MPEWKIGLLLWLVLIVVAAGIAALITVAIPGVLANLRAAKLREELLKEALDRQGMDADCSKGTNHSIRK